jgi:type II secretory pathway pseudopilin PulG
MTMIELGVVMGIVTVLLALVLGLSRHVNEIVKVRSAQAELGEWHEVLNTWFLKYGMYPDPMEARFNNSHVESNLVWLASTTLNTQYIAPGTDQPFCSLMSRRLATLDPWGTPYFYRSTTNAYELLSCGPNTLHRFEEYQNGTLILFPENSLKPTNPERVNDDDIYFEP